MTWIIVLVLRLLSLSAPGAGDTHSGPAPAGPKVRPAVICVPPTPGPKPTPGPIGTPPPNKTSPPTVPPLCA